MTLAITLAVLAGTVLCILGVGALIGLLIGDWLNERDRRRAARPHPQRNPYRGTSGGRTVPPPPEGWRPDRGP